MSPLSSVRGTGGSINDTAVIQNQNTLSHPQGGTKGQFVTTTVGNGTWTVPPGVTKICVVVVGGGGGGNDVDWKGTGGGGGGGLSWGNNMTVKPGDSLPYRIGEGGEGGPNTATSTKDGGDTWIKDSAGNYLVFAEGGEGGSTPSDGNGGEGGKAPQGLAVHGGGDGGFGNSPYDYVGPYWTGARVFGGGGGGAGGYDGNGGTGGWGRVPSPYSGYDYYPGTDGYGGAGGGGMSGWGGGGVGLYGEGPSGEAKTPPGNSGGEGGSGGGDGNSSNPGGGPLGGGGASGGNFYPNDTGEGEDGNKGGMRIVWGCGVTFPDDASEVYPS